MCGENRALDVDRPASHRRREPLAPLLADVSVGAECRPTEGADGGVSGRARCLAGGVAPALGFGEADAEPYLAVGYRRKESFALGLAAVVNEGGVPVAESRMGIAE